MQQPQPRQVFPFHFLDVVVDDTNKNLIQNPADNVDRILGQKLNELSLEERTQAIHELHGVNEIPGEASADTIQNKLKEMDAIVQTFTKSDTESYRLALDTDPNYVERIKLLCLKADLYDSQKAAARMASFFTLKLRTFGKEKLTKDIKLGDLPEQDRRTIQDGVFHLLPQRDRAGRGIMIFLGKRGSEHDPEPCMRMFYYMSMLAARDEEIQNKGLVIIPYMLGQKKFYSDRPGKLIRLMFYLPIRVVALHFCYDRPLMHACVHAMSQYMESNLVCRFRAHFGTYLECTYNLMTYGIPSHVLPLDRENGEIDLQSYHQWLETQKKREALDDPKRQEQPSAAAFGEYVGSAQHHKATENKKKIVVPGPLDIVSGRGRKVKGSGSAGYWKLQNLLEKHSGHFDNADKFEKMVVTDLVLKEFRALGCRFLSNSPETGYSEETDLVCRKKISDAFRNRRKIEKKKTCGGGATKRSFSES